MPTQEPDKTEDMPTKLSALDHLQSYDSCGIPDDAIIPNKQTDCKDNEFSPLNGINKMDEKVSEQQEVDKCDKVQHTEMGAQIPYMNKGIEDKPQAQDWMVAISMNMTENQGGKGSPEPGVPGVDDTPTVQSRSSDLGVETRAIMEKLVTFIQVGFQMEVTVEANNRQWPGAICAMAGTQKCGVLNLS